MGIDVADRKQLQQQFKLGILINLTLENVTVTQQYTQKDRITFIKGSLASIKIYRSG